jgi:UDP-2,4-diacetamido-2,4,6-trideoxy-beta-L-altropyranose hydrolase
MKMSGERDSQSQQRTLLIRADASSRIGSGHFMRCLALAAGWQSRGWDVVFLSYCERSGLVQRVQAAGMSFIPLPHPHPDSADLTTTLVVLEDLCRNRGRPWLILDGYFFDSAYHQAVRRLGYSLLVVDDMAYLPQYYATVLLNQNIDAEDLDYQCDDDCRLLLGTRYVLLRPEFLTWRSWHRQIPDTARRVLITMGGADLGNATAKAVQALRQLDVDGLEVKVVLGTDYVHELKEENLATYSGSNQGKSVLHIVRSPGDMAKLMAWADVAISAGGSTCWELSFMGLPSIVLLLADNQQGIVAGLQKHGSVINLGWHASLKVEDLRLAVSELLYDEVSRLRMSIAGRQLVDGLGVDRVVDSLN